MQDNQNRQNSLSLLIEKMKELGHQPNLLKAYVDLNSSKTYSTILRRDLDDIIVVPCDYCRDTGRLVESFEGDYMALGNALMNICCSKICGGCDKCRGMLERK